jgi:mannose-1-phosphate guanylyltransferase
MTGCVRTKAFLLAAGLGTRLRPLTEWLPKCLVSVAGRPLLEWWLDLLDHAGIREGVINTHAHAERVERYLDTVADLHPVHLRTSYEPRLLGSAGAITANRQLADDADDVVLINADNFCNVDLPALLAYHRSHTDPITIVLNHVENPSACGIARLDDEQRVVSFVEKPRHPESNLANAGIYVVRAAAYREIARMAAFDLGHDVIPGFVGRMRGWLWQGYHRDIGTPQALQRARKEAARLTIAGKPVQPLRRPAVFFDRDGTLIEDVPYLSRPERVRLKPGAAEALRTLRESGYLCVVVTNQSGIGRGLYTESDMHRVNEAMAAQLQAEGAYLDGLYHCAVVPRGDSRVTVENYMRKPGPGMLLKAAHDLELNLDACWMVGDMISDVLAGQNAACQGNILLGTNDRTQELLRHGAHAVVAPDLLTATRSILAGTPALHPCRPPASVQR